MRLEPDVKKAVDFTIELSIDKASAVLSKTLKAGAKIELERTEVVELSKLTEDLMSQNKEDMVGALITLEGDVLIKFLFLIRTEDAFAFTDMMLRRAVGSTQKMGPYTKSAIQEVGNILASALSNVFSKNFGISVWPSTPVMFHDFMDSIFSTFLMESAPLDDMIWLIETKFFVVKAQVECAMFLVPSFKNIEHLRNFVS